MGHIWTIYDHIWYIYDHIWSIYEHIWTIYDHIWSIYDHIWCIYDHIWSIYDHIYHDPNACTMSYMAQFPRQEYVGACAHGGSRGPWGVWEGSAPPGQQEGSGGCKPPK